MSHSNSSLNTFATCMAMYDHRYIKHSPTCKPPSPHLTFGTMAHEVLYKAGLQRDLVKDGIQLDYETCIPSEVLYPELKTEFQITNWHNYFMPVIKKIAEYEEKLEEDYFKINEEEYQILREHKVQMSGLQIFNETGYHLEEPLVGVIDFLILGYRNAVILDYKFSTQQKGQDDFDQNSQLPLYAFFVHHLYGIEYRNILVGYIDIPKKSNDKPTVLSNGTLSRAKNQNITQELYEKSVLAIHGEDPYYNCKPEGYYYDAWCNMALNKPAYLSTQYLDDNMRKSVINDLLSTADMIDDMKLKKRNFLRKYSAYTCKGCEYLISCKPWLGVNND